jgi:hypothetical protein
MKFKVLNLDGIPDESGVTFNSNGISIPINPVPVTFNHSDSPANIMGEAELVKENNAIYAILTVNKNFEGENIRHLTPSVKCTAYEWSNKTVNKCTIDSIGLVLSKNLDHRIESISTQLMKAREAKLTELGFEKPEPNLTLLEIEQENILKLSGN